MLDQGVTSVTDWVQKLQDDELFAFLIGCCPGFLPPLGSYYDFIDRLWLQKTEPQKLGRKDFFPSGKNKKPSKKLSKGQKLPNRHAGIMELMERIALSDRDFPFHYEKAMQKLFLLAAVIPSIQAGLISSDDHSGRGWDSDLGCYYFGYTLYMLSYHNSEDHMNLPLHIRFLDARRHDSVSIFVAHMELRSLIPSLKIRNLCLDSAHDNYPTYRLCGKWDIRLYPPVPRGTAEYKKIYNNRTSSERVNDRVLNDYHLHQMGIHTRKRYTFFAILAGINIHLDARLKKQQQKEHHT